MHPTSVYGAAPSLVGAAEIIVYAQVAARARLSASSPHRLIPSSPHPLIPSLPHPLIASSPQRLIASAPKRLIAASYHCRHRDLGDRVYLPSCKRSRSLLGARTHAHAHTHTVTLMRAGVRAHTQILETSKQFILNATRWWRDRVARMPG